MANLLDIGSAAYRTQISNSVLYDAHNLEIMEHIIEQTTRGAKMELDRYITETCGERCAKCEYRKDNVAKTDDESRDTKVITLSARCGVHRCPHERVVELDMPVWDAYASPKESVPIKVIHKGKDDLELVLEDVEIKDEDTKLW